ncbi:Tripartite ATP-independent periplasmic transporter DctQ component [Spirochaeta thermophila DSM 6578]|uniref:Tripartite ATP-independent periplasmic transporter DctQ component n=2 Tax=Winmispira thermophila TaxID=154 RepID=G0GBA2_WINT7|nr:Tripartite ATP-independent periplasmic transporter DctQ component [Spirochaeta thermophila DSM 6578]
MKILGFVQKAGDLLEEILRIIATFTLGGIALIINVGVISRYILKTSLPWSTELPELLLVLTVLLAAAPAIRKHMFTKVEFFISIWPTSIQKVVSLLSAILILVFLVFCVVASEELVRKAVITKTITPALAIPMSLVYTVFQLGFLLVLLFLFLRLLDLFLSKVIIYYLPPESIL